MQDYHKAIPGDNETIEFTIKERMKAMKLNLDKNLMSLKGEPLHDKLSDILADILAMSSTAKPAKMITWAVNLTNNGEIEVDKSDIQLITELIENNMRIVNLAKAQILDEIEKYL